MQLNTDMLAHGSSHVAGFLAPYAYNRFFNIRKELIDIDLILKYLIPKYPRFKINWYGPATYGVVGIQTDDVDVVFRNRPDIYHQVRKTL